MKKRELAGLGVPRGEASRVAGKAVQAALAAGAKREDLRARVRAVVERPDDYLEDEHFGALAECLSKQDAARARFVPRAEAAPWRQWGEDLDSNAVEQMKHACDLPVSVRGALMPDAHLGYGLPIGGVLATKDAVIPYAVGVDIACRMCLSVLDLPVSSLAGATDRLKNALQRETSFGIGAKFRDRREHDVLDEDWSCSPVTRECKDKAWSQLGSSGSGNHFVEFGEMEVHDARCGLEPGTYLALLSHSGSRGTGAQVASHYSKLAMAMRPELPRELQHLAWLDLSSEAGQEYWRAMELMGKYAAANHAVIHRSVAKNLGVKPLLHLENHHNFAWKEEHDGEEVIVHRKGATPASKGELGIIPGSMASPAYIVSGKGSEPSLRSASHGAGRRMSRKKAKQLYTWSQTKKLLRERGVTLMSAGLDEVPMAYKDIDEVMAAQRDLVEPLARFHPRLVRMAPDGERPED